MTPLAGGQEHPSCEEPDIPRQPPPPQGPAQPPVEMGRPDPAEGRGQMADLPLPRLQFTSLGNEWVGRGLLSPPRLPTLTPPGLRQAGALACVEA